MNPIAAAAGILGNLAGVGDAFAFVNDPKYTEGRNLSANMASVAGDATSLAITARRIQKDQTAKMAEIRRQMNQGSSREHATRNANLTRQCEQYRTRGTPGVTAS